MGKKGWVIFSCVFSAAVIGLLIYDIMTKGAVDSSTVIRTVVLIAAMWVTFFRKNSGYSDAKATKKFFKRAYGEFIGSAFEGKPKQEKLFYAALHNFNNNKLNPALDKLEDLKLECESIDERFAVTFFTALCLDDLGNYEDAAELYEKAFGVKRVSTAISNAGVCYKNMGDFETAERCYLEAVDVDKSAVAYNNLAQLYMETEEFEKALGYAETAIGINAKAPEALTAAAVCCAMLGNETQYAEYLRRATVNGADAEVIRRYIEMLKTEA